MSHGLSERALLKVYEIDSPAESDHLRTCQACTARYAKLSKDLEMISEVLRQQSPRDRGAYHPRIRVALFRKAAAVAVVLLILFSALRVWTRIGSVPLDKSLRRDTTLL